MALIATLIFLATAPSLFAQGMSALIVCVTDTTNSPLPGTTVVASANGTRYTELADGRGCYEFISLPPNSYRVTARLQSFDNATKEKIKVAPGQTVRVNLQLWISPLCECLQPPTTLAGLRNAADAVVHLRITDHETQLPAPLHFFMQTARVLEIMKSHPAGGPRGQATTFGQYQASGAPDPYDVGDELVMFLRWSPVDETFFSYDDTNTVFVVQDDKITRSPVALTRYTGKALADLLNDLRSLSSGK